MDHRCLRREAHRFRVELWSGSDSLGCFTTRDVSPEGAFVETGPVDFRAHEMVTVSFHLESAGISRHDVPALVVHCSDEGLGLMYAAFTADFWHDLAAAMKITA
ncbi:MAG: PilZ domain-containing protein [Gammaproteobacteria bacterium]|nr:PilZ domain-containing protein [Gammaproteobacteria bacterium]NIU06450.1 PilZ domain-containing protein [Gammaproteobacteria bacterium]NIV53342.1 hypothetical protein [Gammaproteobacteria bacterium]NIV74061.1 hypothetical protein [Gammaproteobacteria bacterium]NIX87723.1 hypothetical protein [Gammaproteobacteria bacterium]